MCPELAHLGTLETVQAPNMLSCWHNNKSCSCLIYDLRLQIKVLMLHFNLTIRNAHIYKRIEIDKYGNHQINHILLSNL
jgi:hypothetical protein